MGAMNKRELAKAVAVQADVELKTVVTVIDGFTDVVTAVVSKGEPVSIPGFAKFVKVNRPARMGRNPATGEAIRIKASKKARITPVKAFKDAVLAPATAPKLVKGAYPTSDAAVAAAGKSAAPAAAKKAPARAAAKKAPARKAARHARLPPSGRRQARPRQAGSRQEGREEVAARPVPSPGTGLLRPWSDGRAAHDVGAADRALPLPNHWPIGPSRSRIPTGCRRTIPPTAQIIARPRRGPARRRRHLCRPALGVDRADGRLPGPPRLLLRLRLPALPLRHVSHARRRVHGTTGRPVCSRRHSAQTERSRHERHLTGSRMVVGLRRQVVPA